MLFRSPSTSSEKRLSFNQSNQIPLGWYRRFLPHCDGPNLVQFITYRLADSIPATLLAAVETALRLIPSERMGIERRRRIESLLDHGYGSSILRESAAAECVIESWQRFSGQRYDLLAWGVVPTHVHVLIRMYRTNCLSRVVQTWKSYTGRRLKALFPSACLNGEFWKRE